MADNINRSTPLAEFKCPRVLYEVGDEAEHVVTANGDNEYECECGEVFDWFSQTNWKRVAASEEA